MNEGIRLLPVLGITYCLAKNQPAFIQQASDGPRCSLCLKQVQR